MGSHASRSLATSVVAHAASWLLCLHPPAHPELAVAHAADMRCVVRECKPELAACMQSGSCARGIACAGASASDPLGQVRCMDLYEDSTLRSFSECAMTQSRCVPPLAGDTSDAAEFDRARAALQLEPPAVPPVDELLSGTWKLTLGLNPAFDKFDCQVHTFSKGERVGATRSVPAVFRYRVHLDGDKWFTREGGKRITQPDPSRPHELLLRLEPAYLNYEDKWLVLGAQVSNSAEEPWFAVRYHGSNAAWEGYGGANVYTRSGHVPPVGSRAYRAIEGALRRGGLRMDDMTAVDNSCTPWGERRPPAGGGRVAR